MKILRKITHTKKIVNDILKRNKTIGFVPTMGYLHEGHISLIKEARKKNDYVFVSIFVNPTQFSPSEDLEKYPRNFERDKIICKQFGVDYIFFPSQEEMYNSDYSTFVEVENITNKLEGKIRPTHFRGVATVVLKLFNIIQPSTAYFGQKDAQQCAVILKMVKELNINVKLKILPTIRETDGLAMSSRNVYLNKEQRNDAIYLYKALLYARRKLETESYNKDIDFLKKQMYKLIKTRKTVTKIDYISFNDNNTLEELKSLKNCKNTEILVSLAVRFGKVRLIDNIIIKY
jgi:pantoate--beta-alanine ligase